MRPDEDPDFQGASSAWTNIAESISGFATQGSQMKISQVLQGGWKEKVPTLIALVKACTMVDHNMFVELKDPTGEIQATVHREVLQEHPTLTIGCALALQKVSVFSPTPKKHYLNICLNNVIIVEHPSKDHY